MSALHLRQIDKKLQTLLYPLIDMKDQKQGTVQFDDVVRSRALAAYIVHHLTDCTPLEAAESVVDGSGDNGLDAVFFHDSEETLYLVQSKWFKDGIGEPDNGSVKKFTAGVKDLISQDYERFNEKLQKRRDEIDEILGIPTLKIAIILVHSGASDLSALSVRDLDDLEREINDASDALSWMAVNQKRLHQSLTEDINRPVTIEFPIQYWGKLEDPKYAIFGMVTATDLGQAWLDNRDRLVAKNLRGSLGDTDVNREIKQSLEDRPDQFWYFNNGITATAKKVTRLPKGGGKHELGYFHCEDLHVVNGAQTVSTIGHFLAKNPDADLSSCLVQFRVIELGEDGESFGDEVTRTNNRQNKIDAKDFVSQDSEQKRIRSELLIDKVNYQIMRREDSPKGDRDFDLQDSTTALACASGDVTIIVILKNQIGRLWEDLSKSPYRTLFNPSVSGTYVWNCVQTQRLIDLAIEYRRSKAVSAREQRILTSGNRIISGLIFQLINLKRFEDQTSVFDDYVDSARIADVVNTIAYTALTYMQSFHAKALIPNFFKNQTKSRELFDYVTRQHSKSKVFYAPRNRTNAAKEEKLI